MLEYCAKRTRITDIQDGEPSGTTDKPIYGVILSRNLSNSLIVVIRYFGGTLLGTCGLIQAYRRAAETFINTASIIEKFILHNYTLIFTEVDMNLVMNICKYSEAKILSRNYHTEHIIQLQVKKLMSTTFIKKITKFYRFSVIQEIKTA